MTTPPSTDHADLIGRLEARAGQCHMDAARMRKNGWPESAEANDEEASVYTQAAAAIRTLTASLSRVEAERIPGGCVIVPIEPSEDMLISATDAYNCEEVFNERLGFDAWRTLYRAMIDARPPRRHKDACDRWLALSELVRIKDKKDAEGPYTGYDREKNAAWAAARNCLSRASDAEDK